MREAILHLPVATIRSCKPCLVLPETADLQTCSLRDQLSCQGPFCSEKEVTREAKNIKKVGVSQRGGLLQVLFHWRLQLVNVFLPLPANSLNPKEQKKLCER